MIIRNMGKNKKYCYLADACIKKCYNEKGEILQHYYVSDSDDDSRNRSSSKDSKDSSSKDSSSKDSSSKDSSSKDSSSKDNKSGFLSSFTGDLRSSLDSNNSSNLKIKNQYNIPEVIQVDNNIGEKKTD